MKITKIKLKNFKQYTDFEWNLSKNSNVNLIYGPNGSGKSTLIHSLKFLALILEPKFANDFFFLKNLYNQFSTIGTEEEISVTIEFEDYRNKYSYSVSVAKGDIVTKEKFELLSNGITLFEKKRGELLNMGTIKDLFNNELFTFDENYMDSIGSTLHALIMKYPEVYDFNRELFSLANLLYPWLTSKPDDETEDKIFLERMIDELSKRSIIKVQKDAFEKIKPKLENFMEKFSYFASEIDHTVMGVSHTVKHLGNDTIELSYSFKKRVANKLIDINVQQESKGTKTYMMYFKSLIKLEQESNKNILTIDEFGTFIHETLALNIYKKIVTTARENNRQLLIATHSLNLLDKDLVNLEADKDWNKEKWILDKSPTGKAAIKDLRNINSRTNFRNLYISGSLGGIHSGEIS